MGLTEPSPLPKLLDVNFTIYPDQGKSQSNVAKAIGLVITRNLGASISSPLLSFLSTLRRAYGSWKLPRAALEKRCLRGGITGSMLDLQTSFLVHQVLCFRTTAQVDKKHSNVVSSV